MLYPLKFNPVYKDYIWGGRNLEKIGKQLPEGKVAESWEISSHPDGISTVFNGEYKGMTLSSLIARHGSELTGYAVHRDSPGIFPLLVKFIDANDNLSVQVHPDDYYARIHEDGIYGKNEMWYILSAEPGAKVIYDVILGTTREKFAQAVRNNKIEKYLNQIEVFAGDVINIPAGLIHSIGKGILLVEIQQNSNTTYRVYDYNRVDKSGMKRPLHVEKALEVINFNNSERKAKYPGLKVQISSDCSKKHLIANKYFSVELYEIGGALYESTDGSTFLIYVFVEGAGTVRYGSGHIEVRAGEAILIPAFLGNFTIEGRLKALKSYVPDIELNVVKPLVRAGYSMQDIYENIGGLKQTPVQAASPILERTLT
jgi:mannose-6-phosphate isomerase